MSITVRGKSRIGPTTSSIDYKLYYDANILSSYPGTGTAWYDLSKNNITGTLSANTIFNNNSPKSFTFDSGGSVLFNSISLYDGRSGWTTSAWIKTNYAGSGLATGPILTNSSGGPVNCQMGINGGKMVYWIYGNTWYSKLGTVTVNNDNWHYLTWVQKNNYTMSMYVDGTIDVADFVSSGSTGNSNPVNYIGSSWGGPSYSFRGEIALLTIHNFSLTSTEVLNYYNVTKKRFI